MTLPECTTVFPIGDPTGPSQGPASAGAIHVRKTIPVLFEEQAARTPDAVAVVYEDAELTYRELNERANRLAHYLRALGAGPGARIGICVERSLAMVVGVLGILKAGCAYVPLDRNYPQERISYMVEDSEAEILLVEEKLAEKISSSRARLVVFERERKENRAAIQRKPCQPNYPGPSRLRYLHLRINRQAQGRVHLSSQRGAPGL